MATEDSRAAEGRGQLTGIDFSTFLLSLSTTALYQMGLVTEPGSGQKMPPDPLLARQTIDTLEMLHRKTRGNLEPEEAKLFESLLYELRIHIVELEG
jgi:hypothetical protein